MDGVAIKWLSVALKLKLKINQSDLFLVNKSLNLYSNSGLFGLFLLNNKTKKSLNPLSSPGAIYISANFVWFASSSSLIWPGGLILALIN